MSAIGRANAGRSENNLDMGEKILTQNLVSIPKLDRAGLTTTFSKGWGIVTNDDGNVIARAPLKDNNLYEFDIC